MTVKRREFIKTATTTATVLAAQGYLPLLAGPRKRGRKGKGVSTSQNCFTEPCAIEPITGYLPKYSPATGPAMSQAFNASYTLVGCHGAAAKSKNSESGSMEVSFKKGKCRTVEMRRNRPLTSVLKTSLDCKGELNTVSSWTLESSIGKRADLSFTEKGTWDGKSMTVTADAWTQKHATANPLIARWALLPLLATGQIKTKPLTFDMLDDSTLRPNQTLRFEGEVEIPVKGGTIKLDSYAQTGQGIVPTHYLVDSQGRVQLITMATVNWTLTSVAP